MKTKALLLIALTALILAAGCDSPDRPVNAPRPAPGVDLPAMTSEVKVVEMVTQTPTRFVDAPTPTPTPFDSPLAGEATFTPTPLAPVSGPTLAELGVDAVTYIDDWAGFALDYPAGWELTAPLEEVKANSTAYSVTFLSREVVRGPKQQEGIPAGVTKIDVSVMKDAGPTMEEAVAQRREQLISPDSRVMILAEETIALQSGLQVVRFHLDTGSGPAVELVTAINGHMLLIDGLGDLTLFNAISESLREQGS